MKYKNLFLGSIFACFLLACRDKNSHYKNILLENLVNFENIATGINEKYNIGKTNYVIPFLRNEHHDPYVFYDSSIYQFCKKYNVNSITVYNDSIRDESEAIIEFSLSDNNIRYLYYGMGNNPNKNLENNRVISTRINKFWQFNHLKKEW